MISQPLSSLDLQTLADGVPRESLEDLRGAHILITGGTGFVGKWLVQGLLHLDKISGLNLKLTILCRNPQRSLQEMSWLGDSRVHLLHGDILNFASSPRGYTHILHAAVSASADLNENQPEQMFRLNMLGMENILQVASENRVRSLLLTSSGAVYGRLPAEISHVAETYMGGPDPYAANAAYGEGKRVAEMMGSQWAARRASEWGGKFLSARCFAFVGPYLPLSIHFAVGNFIRDCLAGKTIIIGGDGTPRRSLMYGSDMVAGLLAILLRGESCRPYNLGSEQSISILEMAQMVDAIAADIFSERKKLAERIIVKGQPIEGRAPERYVPSIKRLTSELSFHGKVTTEEGIRRAINSAAAFA